MLTMSDLLCRRSCEDSDSRINDSRVFPVFVGTTATWDDIEDY